MNYKQQMNISPKSRNIILSDNISQNTIGTIMTTILEIEESDKLFKDTYGDNYEIFPIKLYINSYGGKVYPGFGLIDLMRTCNTPINTYCMGLSASMGFEIWLYGKKRFIGKHSTIVYHEIASDVYDSLEGIKLKVEELERLQDMGDERIKAISLIKQEQLDKYRTTKSEWYITPEEALRLELASAII